MNSVSGSKDNIAGTASIHSLGGTVFVGKPRGDDGLDVSSLSAYTDLMLSLRKFIETLIEYSGVSLGELKDGQRKVLEDSFAKEMEMWRKQIESESKSIFEKIFSAIGLAFGAIFTAVMAVVAAPVPVLAVVLAICASWMLLQLSATVQDMATNGDNFMRNFMKAVCGGNEAVAGWMTMAIDIMTAAIALACAFLMPAGAPGAISNLSAKLTSLCPKLIQTFDDAAQATAKAGKAGLAAFYKSLAATFSTLPKLNASAFAKIREQLKSLFKLLDDVVTAAKSTSADRLRSSVGVLRDFIKNLTESLFPGIWSGENKTQIFMTISTFMSAAASAFSMIKDFIQLDVADLKLEVDRFHAFSDLLQSHVDLISERISDLNESLERVGSLTRQGLSINSV